LGQEAGRGCDVDDASGEAVRLSTFAQQFTNLRTLWSQKNDDNSKDDGGPGGGSSKDDETPNAGVDYRSLEGRLRGVELP
jgi:hypothetical protein